MSSAFSCETVLPENGYEQSIVNDPLFLGFCQRAIRDTFEGHGVGTGAVRDLGLAVPAWIHYARTLVDQVSEGAHQAMLRESPLFSDDPGILFTLHTYVVGRMY